MNIHAESMRQYAEDAKHIDKPYLLWEICRYKGQEWHPCTDHPEWYFWELYRRKDCSFKANKHQKLMEQYAVDAKTSWSPYVNYQFKNGRGEWEYLGSPPSWDPDIEYRREIKMKTVLINNKEVTLGASSIPEEDQFYYIPDLVTPGKPNMYQWYNDEYDRTVLARNMVFLKEEDAINFAKAITE